MATETLCRSRHFLHQKQHTLHENSVPNDCVSLLIGCIVHLNNDTCVLSCCRRGWASCKFTRMESSWTRASQSSCFPSMLKNFIPERSFFYSPPTFLLHVFIPLFPFIPCSCSSTSNHVLTWKGGQPCIKSLFSLLGEFKIFHVIWV